MAKPTAHGAAVRFDALRVRDRLEPRSALAELPYLAVGAFAVLVAFAAIPVLLLDQDETVYALVASDLLDGKLPYQGVFDHKPVGVYYVYALFLGLFGESVTAVRLMTLTMLFGGAALVALALRRLGLDRAATIAGTCTLLAFPIGFDGLAGNTEIIQTFLLALVVLLSARSLPPGAREESTTAPSYTPLVAIGAVVALGFSVNYLFSFLALFAFVPLVVFRARCSSRSFLERARAFLRDGLLALVGFIVGSLLVYSPYLVDAVQGGNLLRHYLHEQQVFLSVYGSPRHETQFLINLVFRWAVPFVPIVVAAAAGGRDAPHGRYLKTLGMATLAAAALAASMSGMFFNHYWVLASVPLALCTALAVQEATGRRSLQILGLGSAAVLLFVAFSGTGRIVSHHRNAGGSYDFNRAVAFIEKTVPEGAQVASLNSSSVYVWVNHLDAPQKYQFQGHVLQMADAGHLNADDYYLALLDEGREYALVDPELCTGPWAATLIRTCATLADRYRQLASFEGTRPVTVYERR